MNMHQAQRDFCQSMVDVGKVPILNGACKEDPANLGHLFDVVNLDLWTIDEQTNTDMTLLPNFQQGDLLDMTELFEDECFGAVVIGEFLEHCVYEAAVTALREAFRITIPGGNLFVTFPLDPRPAEAQHAKKLLKIVVPGVTGHDIVVWHQHVWTEDELTRMFWSIGWHEKERIELDYSFLSHIPRPHGWAIRLEK